MDFQTCLFPCPSAASHMAVGRDGGCKCRLYWSEQSVSEQWKDPACATLKTWAPFFLACTWLSSLDGSRSQGSWQLLRLEQLLGVLFSLWNVSKNQRAGNQIPDLVSVSVLMTGNLNTQTQHRKIRGRLLKVQHRESTFGSCSQERHGEGYYISLSFWVALQSPSKSRVGFL